jgi:hypothetical protein
MYQLQSRHIIMALPLFVVSTVGRGLWNEISKELVTTHLKIFQDRFCHINVIPTRRPETGPLVTRAQIFVIFSGKKQSKYSRF